MSDERPLYTVNVHREEGLWVAVVDGVPAGATDVGHFVDLDDAVRDLIATFADVDPEDFDVEWRFAKARMT